MDHFEAIIGTLLEHDGYWVRHSFKVGLTKQEKRNIGKPSLPRPEIDILAFDFKKREVLVIEAKSYLDSLGVQPNDLSIEYKIPTGRYKLFTCSKYRRTILSRLKSDLLQCGMISKNTTLRLGLAAGKVHGNDPSSISRLFKKKSWFFWSPTEIKQRVLSLASEGYENDPSVITAKILQR